MSIEEGFMVGYPPIVEVTERMLISQVPEQERAMFLAFAKAKAQKNRSGEEVFEKGVYTKWKSLS